MDEKVLQDQDVQLMLRFQAGDEAAFETLVEKYRMRVLAVAYRFLQKHSEAEDVVQETFLRMYRAKAQYQAKGKFSSWLFIITNRLCLNVLRGRQRHREESLQLGESQSGDNPSKQWEDKTSPHALKVLENEEIQMKVRQAVQELPPDERMAIILDHWENMPLEAISQVLNKSVGAVKSILFRARAKLRVKMAAYLNPRELG